MVNVYIVKAPHGEYEDYREPIVKVFATKEEAEQKLTEIKGEKSE